MPIFIKRGLGGTITEYGTLTIQVVKDPQGNYLWGYLLHHYHYLGNPRLVVEHIRHIAYIDNQVVACLGWASAAWKVRDGIVSSDGMNLPNDALASDSQ